jgi:hypothetical protein
MYLEDAIRILQLSTDYTPDDIKKNYKRLAMKYHPDKGGGCDLFQELNTAYTFINKNQTMDPSLISDFINDILKSFNRPFKNEGSQDIFRDFSHSETIGSFKERFIHPQTNKVLKKSIEITPLEYFTGIDKCTCEENACFKCNYCNLISIPKCMDLSKSIKGNITVSISDKRYFYNKKLYYHFDISLKQALTGFDLPFKDPFDTLHRVVVANKIIKQNDGYIINFKNFRVVLVFNIVYPKSISKLSLEQLKIINF